MPVPNTNRYDAIPDTDTTVITTRRGDTFLIDSCDRELASRHCWSRHEHGYARAVTRCKSTGRLKTIYLHRLIRPTTEDRPHVDHINGDCSDCRSANLRACSRQENLRNQKLRADNLTGFKGVGLHRPSQMYRARVRAGGVIIDAGLFRTPEEAAKVATERREQLHGTFARHE